MPQLRKYVSTSLSYGKFSNLASDCRQPIRIHGWKFMGMHLLLFWPFSHRDEFGNIPFPANSIITRYNFPSLGYFLALHQQHNGPTDVKANVISAWWHQSWRQPLISWGCYKSQLVSDWRQGGGDSVISEDLNIYQSLIPDLLQNCMDKTSDVK